MFLRDYKNRLVAARNSRQKACTVAMFCRVHIPTMYTPLLSGPKIMLEDQWTDWTSCLLWLSSVPSSNCALPYLISAISNAQSASFFASSAVREVLSPWWLQSLSFVAHSPLMYTWYTVAGYDTKLLRLVPFPHSILSSCRADYRINTILLSNQSIHQLLFNSWHLYSHKHVLNCTNLIWVLICVQLF